jgi:4-oxalocrotonate tautomerase
MPLIHVHLTEGKTPKYIQALCEGIHKALRTAWKIPANDRFQMVSEHRKGHFHFDKTIWGVKHSNNVIVICITSIKRSQNMKKALYTELVKVLGKNPKVRKEDVFVSITQVEKEDWSFGNGIAQLLDPSMKP